MSTIPATPCLIAAVAALSSMKPLSRPSTAQFVVVLDELSDIVTAIPPALGPCLQAHLGAFGSLPPSSQGGAAPPAAAAAACLSYATRDPRARAYFTARDAKAQAARRGLYALVARAAATPRGHAHWTHEPESIEGCCEDVVYAALTGLANFVVRAVGQAEASAVTECFKACAEALGAMLGSAEMSPAKVRLAARAALALLGERSPVDGAAAGRALALPVAKCIVRCGGAGKEEMRPLLHKVTQVLGNIVARNSSASGLKEMLGSEVFGQAMVTVERELLALSVGSSTPSGRGASDASLFFGPPVSDAALADAFAKLVSALHACPHAWATATALRKKKSPYTLLAILIRMPPLQLPVPHDAPAAKACQSLNLKLSALLANSNAEGWARFVKSALVEGGCYAALLLFLQRPECSGIWWHGALLVQNVIIASNRMHASQNVAIQLRPVDDKALLKTLVANVTSLLPRIALGVGVVQYDDVLAVSELLKALASLSSEISGNAPLASRLSVSKVGATKLVSRAILAFNLLTPRCIVGFLPGNEMPTTSQMLIEAHAGLLTLTFSMASIPSEYGKFLAVPGATGAIVKSTCAAYSLTSAKKCDAKEKDAAVRALNAGLHALSELACSVELASQIVAAKQSGSGDAVQLAQSILADAQWPRHIQTSNPPSERFALLFLGNIVDAQAGAVGRHCAGDERMVRGLLRVIALGEKGRDPTSFAFCVQCFGNFALSFLPESPEFAVRALEVVTVWQKAGVFNALPRALVNSNNTSIIASMFAVARLATSVCCSDGGHLVPGNRIGNAPLLALSESGIQRLLDRPDSMNCRFGPVGMVNMLKVDFASLFLLNRPGGGGSAGIDAQKDDPQRLMQALGETMGVAMGLHGMGGTVGSDDAPRPPKHVVHSLNDGVGGVDGRVADLVNLSHDDPTKRHWGCSNPGCESAHSTTTKPMQCTRCGSSRYCSRDCQKIDWPVHKITCASRPWN